MNVIAEIDKLLAEDNSAQERAGESYSIGWEEALLKARKLALAYVKHRQGLDIGCSTLIHQLMEENAVLLKQVEEARFELSRGVLDLVVPRPEQTLAEIVAEVVKEFGRTAVAGGEHVCECDCDEDALSWAQREEIRGVINTLKGML